MLALLALFVSPNADAYVFWGNPTLKLEIDRSEGDLTGGTVDLLGVRVHKCSGAYADYYADQTIDPVVGWSTTIAGGNICQVQVRWDSDGQVWSSAFTLKSSVLVTSVDIDAPVSSEPWSPYVVASGSFSGSDPEVVITIQ
ncbi:MAG: hypothetical protein H6737_23245 [Alphaproteobacteria bacterium]|nr:hypothetical protein [Alphaproteobacteria bacterium]